MTQYTPTTEDVREEWALHRNVTMDRGRAEFDRWLAEHDRQVAEAADDLAARAVLERVAHRLQGATT